MIIDFHAHLLPKEIVENPLAFALKDAYFGYRMFQAPFKKSEQGGVTYQEALEDMDKDGIHQLVIQGWPMETYESCYLQNDYTLEAMNTYPDRFIGFCVVNPKDGVNALREAERCARAGLKGLGELDPIGQGFNLEDEDFLRLCDLCVDLGLPMSLHINEPIGPRHLGRLNIPLQSYVNLAKAKPLLKIILAHWGGGLPFYELMPDLKKSLTNVYYDTAGGPLHCSPRIFQETLNLIGDKKLLFGSNYPRLLDWQEKKMGFSPLLTIIKKEITEQNVLENLLHKNASRLLQLVLAGGDNKCLV